MAEPKNRRIGQQLDTAQLQPSASAGSSPGSEPEGLGGLHVIFRAIAAIISRKKSVNQSRTSLVGKVQEEKPSAIYNSSSGFTNEELVEITRRIQASMFRSEILARAEESFLNQPISDEREQLSKAGPGQISGQTHDVNR